MRCIAAPKRRAFGRRACPTTASTPAQYPSPTPSAVHTSAIDDPLLAQEQERVVEAALDVLAASPAFGPAICGHLASTNAEIASYATSILYTLAAAWPAVAEEALAAPGLLLALLRRASGKDGQAAAAAAQLLHSLAGESPSGSVVVAVPLAGAAVPLPPSKHDPQVERMWEVCGGECMKELGACIANHAPGSIAAVFAVHVLYRAVANDTHGAAARARLFQEAASRPALVPALAAVLSHLCHGGRVEACEEHVSKFGEGMRQPAAAAALGTLDWMFDDATRARDGARLEVLASVRGVAAALEAALRAGAAQASAGAGAEAAVFQGALLSTAVSALYRVACFPGDSPAAARARTHHELRRPGVHAAGCDPGVAAGGVAGSGTPIGDPGGRRVGPGG